MKYYSKKIIQDYEDGVLDNSAEIARMKAFAAATGGMDFVC